jgi:hypothetical protein
VCLFSQSGINKYFRAKSEIGNAVLLEGVTAASSAKIPAGLKCETGNSYCHF